METTAGQYFLKLAEKNKWFNPQTRIWVNQTFSVDLSNFGSWFTSSLQAEFWFTRTFCLQKEAFYELKTYLKSDVD